MKMFLRENLKFAKVIKKAILFIVLLWDFDQTQIQLHKKGFFIMAEEFKFVTEVPKNVWGPEFEDIFVYPMYDEGKVAMEITVAKGVSKIAWEVLDKGKKIASGSSTDFKAGKVFKATEEIKKFKPWNVNTPYLYQFKTTLTLKSGEEKSATIRFGMRKFSVDKESFYLNNEKLFLRGVIRGREAHDHPDLANLGMYEYYAKYMRQMKDYGFNFIRFHSYVPPIECFEAADELGILIHVEMRKYYGRYQKERAKMESRNRLMNPEEWIEMLLRLRNSTSLMVYCMGNEIDHPGRNPICQEFYDMTHKYDPTRFFLDTCSRGEFDRNSVDLDVQHMSYFYPWGHSYNMFENPQNWIISGSASGIPMIEKNAEDDEDWKIARKVPSRRPVLAHEICHYAGLRDLDALEAKFDKYCPDKKPWWIGELKKLAKLKGFSKKDYAQMKKASDRFQLLSWKLGLEASRRSKILSGYHFLQFCDTDRYENSNGIVDCFDDKKGIDDVAFRKFNGDTVLLADMPRRVFFEGEKFLIPAMVSHFSAELSGEMVFRFALKNSKGETVFTGDMPNISLTERGRHEICEVTLKFPKTGKPQAYELVFELINEKGEVVVDNTWNLWTFPNNPAALPKMEVNMDLAEVAPTVRYPQLIQSADAKLMISNRFSKKLIDHVANGGDAWVMYRVPITRDRKVRAAKEKYYLPAVWERFKAIIWDRGHNSGAFMRKSGALAGFPNDGFVDMQFANLINDSDKIILDDFPVKVAPIMEGVDRAVRDRYDVHLFQLSELQPAYTMRKFAYMMELKVGKGRLFVTAFNFTGLNNNDPETVGMFESIMRYLASSKFAPKAEISAKKLSSYLLAKGKGPIVKERRMTQYWQLDEEPLESRKYWQDALDYIGEEVKVQDYYYKEQTTKLSTEEVKDDK